MIEAFWNEISQGINRKHAGLPLVILTDSNSKQGSEQSSAIGPWNQEQTTDRSRPFHDFLLRHRAWLPATFDTSHPTTEGGTWQHTNGNWSRLDFVGLPQDWSYSTCQSWTATNIDLSICREDHRMAVCSFQCPIKTKAPPCRFLKTRLHDDDVDVSKLWEGRQEQWLDPATDVHSHAAAIQRHIVQTIRVDWKTMTPRPQKRTISADTWNLVLEKRDWRNTLAFHQKQRNREALLVVFAMWRAATTIDLDDEDQTIHLQLVAKLDELVALRDFAVAHALSKFRQLGRQVLAATRKDDRRFFADLLAKPADHLSPGEVRQFWNIIRRSFPKFKQRRQGIPTFQRADLDDQFMPYFQRLEAGTPTTAEDLVQACHDRQMSAQPTQIEFEIHEVPSIIALEDELRSTQAHRATGFDLVPSKTYRQAATPLATLHFGLLVKTWLWGHEPVCHKGGHLTVLPKRPYATEPAHFCGIMLLPSFAKRLHALVRRKVIAALAPCKSPGQLGGMPLQQVSYGSHALRTCCRVFDAYGLSTGVVFLDLATAFHKLIREMVSGVASQNATDLVVTDLERQGYPSEVLKAALQRPAVLEEIGVPGHLIALLRDIHCQTWFSLDVLGGIDQLAITHKGTRPGSPLADAIFHLMMHSVLQAFHKWTSSQQEFMAILENLDTKAETIIWSDDIAVVWATSDCRDLPEQLRAIVAAWDEILLSNGFSLNLARGKTSIVATFRGAHAPTMRAHYQTGESPGDEIMLRGKLEKLCYVPCYKHLGTSFTSKHTLDHEISTRLGIAQSAFAAIARQLLCNRHLPQQRRIQLFQSLICSKLYFGLGAWHTPSTRQLQRLKGAMLRMIKKILRISPEEGIPVHTILDLKLVGLLEPRSRLALDRLLYAQKVWENGPSFLQHLLLREDMVQPNSWIAGLKADLEWLWQLVDPPDPTWRDGDLTELLDFWQSGNPQWRRLVKSAWRRYHLQEAMILEADKFHRDIFTILRQHQASFEGDVTGKLRSEATRLDFECDKCQRCFTSAVGLATHRRKMHGIYSLEHDLLQGDTCPACLRKLWSTARLQQHLAYIPRGSGVNPCYQWLRRQGYTTDYEAVRDNSLHAGLHRLEAVPIEGPQHAPLGALAAELTRVDQALQTLDEELRTPQEAPDSVNAVEDLQKQLYDLTMAIFHRYDQADSDPAVLEELPDAWTALLSELEPRFHPWAEFHFLRWGDNGLQDLIAELVHGEAERIIDDADCVEDFPRFDMQRRRSYLRQRKQRLLDQSVQIFPHREVQRGSASAGERLQTAQKVPNLFAHHDEWWAALRLVKWEDLPPEVPPGRWMSPTQRPCFLIVHLFSGRRREGDCHDALHRAAAARNFDVVVLSMDTAVSQTHGDLSAHGLPWCQLLRLMRLGRVAGILCGPPCETYTEARYNTPDPESPDAQHHWPRPLRSWARLLGLPGLTLRELRQTRQGTAFFLQCMVSMAWMMVTGGLFLFEHPWKPSLSWRPSVWTTPIVQLFEGHPGVHLWRIAQWRWGCEAVKPTGILTFGLPSFGKSLYSRQDPGATYPQTYIIGKDEATGKFKTHNLKEYPQILCAAFAGAITDQLHWSIARTVPPSEDLVPEDLRAWVDEVAAVGSEVSHAALILPDYQGL